MFVIVWFWFIIFYYLNDFFATLHENIEIQYQIEFDDLCNKFDFSVNHKKNVCDMKIEFLNIELNNIVMKIRFSSKKLKKIKLDVVNALQYIFITYLNFQSLIDFLSFVVKMMISDRVFFRRLFDAFRVNVKRHRIIIV